jgi:hypothetical protein
MSIALSLLPSRETLKSLRWCQCSDAGIPSHSQNIPATTRASSRMQVTPQAQAAKDSFEGMKAEVCIITGQEF